MWVCTSPEAHRESNVSRWEAVVLLLDISRKTTVAQVRETVVFRCFAGCLVQARNHCNNRCCGLRNNASDVRPTDAAGVKPPSQTLASVFFAGCLVQALTWCVRLLLAKIVKFSVLKILKHTTFLENSRRKFLPPFGGLLFNIPYQIQPEYGDEQADAGRKCRTCLARPDSQARTRTGKYSFFLFS